MPPRFGQRTLLLPFRSSRLPHYPLPPTPLRTTFPHHRYNRRTHTRIVLTPFGLPFSAVPLGSSPTYLYMRSVCVHAPCLRCDLLFRTAGITAHVSYSFAPTRYCIFDTVPAYGCGLDAHAASRHFFWFVLRHAAGVTFCGSAHSTPFHRYAICRHFTRAATHHQFDYGAGCALPRFVTSVLILWFISFCLRSWTTRVPTSRSLVPQVLCVRYRALLARHLTVWDRAFGIVAFRSSPLHVPPFAAFGPTCPVGLRDGLPGVAFWFCYGTRILLRFCRCLYRGLRTTRGYALYPIVWPPPLHLRLRILQRTCGYLVGDPHGCSTHTYPFCPVALLYVLNLRAPLGSDCDLIHTRTFCRIVITLRLHIPYLLFVVPVYLAFLGLDSSHLRLYLDYHTSFVFYRRSHCVRVGLRVLAFLGCLLRGLPHRIPFCRLDCARLTIWTRGRHSEQNVDIYTILPRYHSLHYTRTALYAPLVPHLH